jgi:hypothetical protein
MYYILSILTFLFAIKYAPDAETQKALIIIGLFGVFQILGWLIIFKLFETK